MKYKTLGPDDLLKLKIGSTIYLVDNSVPAFSSSDQFILGKYKIGTPFTVEAIDLEMYHVVLKEVKNNMSVKPGFRIGRFTDRPLKVHSVGGNV